MFSFLKKKKQTEKAPVTDTPKSEFDKNDVSLILKDIVKVYGEGETKVKALKGINLKFRRNEFVSVLGPSGCGKTTLLNIIGGLDRYTDGDLIINGKSTKEYKDSDWDTYRNNSIGFVFQSYNLIQHQTVINNVELSLTLSGVTKAERRKRAEKALEQVGLKGLENKLPNQMSGGQMQRVAIARALVNDPDIILADEPTGALDTETSIQVMELLKKVAEDRLVIMVTHNPELAEKYSTRIINLLDGEKTGDTNPVEDNAKTVKHVAEKGRAAMKLSTAFALSLSNLKTKKGRTILTSIAGSIGIIGIALVLAVSTGFSGYINKLQADTLSVYPLTISESTIDLSDFNKLMEKTQMEKFPAVKKVYERQMFSKLTDMLKSNKLTEEYIKYINDFANSENEKAKDTDEKWKYSVEMGYGFDVNNYIFTNIGYNLLPVGTGEVRHDVMPIDTLVQVLEAMFNTGMIGSNLNISAEFVREYIPTLSEIPDNEALIKSQYDLLEGEWATEKDDLLLVVNSTNSVTDITLALLGFIDIEGFDMNTYSVAFSGGDDFTMSFSEAMSKKFYFIDNNTRYQYLNENNYRQKLFSEDETAYNKIPESALTLNIKGIVRLKENVSEGVLDTGIAYTTALKEYVLESNKNSEIVSTAKTYSGAVNVYGLSTTPKEYKVAALAGDSTVRKISIYSSGYAAKEEMKTYLDKWNEPYDKIIAENQTIVDSDTATPAEKAQAQEKIDAAKEEQVHYSDSTAMLFSAMNTIVDAVKIILISFTAISLVVSSIMIGIITYVSVVERTKEIGVLRSLGARKKDISRIFNAETFMIGLFAGLIGVIVTYLLSIPINIIIGQFIANAGAIAALKITHALILVAVSFILTLIAGIIPARIAAKKDPVVALRTE